MMKILLVDDDTFLRDMYATKFIECGYLVTPAIHATDALRLLASDNFDLMLVDMIMPGMTGVELLLEIKKVFPDITMKCIMLSNQGQSEDISEAKAAGAIGYIIKAQSVPSEVVKRVEEIMKSQ